MDRTIFYQKTIVDGIEEHDYLTNSLSDFVINYEPSYYTVQESDLLRPDAISHKFYKSVSYWWLICYINEIKDPFNDLSVGKLLIIPNVLDIYDFFKKYKTIGL